MTNHSSLCKGRPSSSRNDASFARAWACALLDALDITLAPPQSGHTTTPSVLQMLQLAWPRSRIEEAFQRSRDISSGKYELRLASASLVVEDLRSFTNALTHRAAGGVRPTFTCRLKAGQR